MLEIFLPNPLWFILYDFGREYSLPGCFPLLVSELAAVVPCRENAHSAHWFSQIVFLWSFPEWRSDFPSTPIFVLLTYFGGEFDDLLTELTSMWDETQSLCHLPPMIIHYLAWKDFGRENLSPGCPPFLASELAAVVPCGTMSFFQSLR